MYQRRQDRLISLHGQCLMHRDLICSVLAMLLVAPLIRLKTAAQHQGDVPDLPDEVSVASSEAGSESPTAAGRGSGSLRSQSADTLAVADAIAQVAEVLSPP